MRFAIVMAALVVLGMSACRGGDGGDDNTPTGVVGEVCEAVDSTVCGVTEGEKDSVLICTAFDDKGTNKWTEKQVCSKAENCVEGSKCQIDCESAWICDGKECGDDGCDGSCGGCDAGKSCMGGKCKDITCYPACGAAECGPDGCGNTCGECGGTTVCMPPAYVCMDPPSDCKPDCLNKACGPNGCGGSCGSCPGGTFCFPETQTCELPCMPDCTGKGCGDDGCGGSCGVCTGADEFCLPDGTCGPCDPVLNAYCPPEQYCTYGNDDAGNPIGPICQDAGTQKYGELCGGVDSCAEGICSALNEGEALCYQICKTNSDCGEGKQCIELTNAKYKLCTVGGGSSETCNLLNQGCTLPEEACYFSDQAGEPICMAEGSGEEGEDCTGQANDCAEGLTCASYSSTWACHRFCNTKKGEEPSCDKNSLFAQCKNYYALQQAGFCVELATCGSADCDAGETCMNCPSDCGECCGNGTCDQEHAENCSTCEADCGECCGNGTCDQEYNEDCSTCEADCGECACEPDCTDKACDEDDGCGELCGCPDGEECVEGECQA